MKHTLLVLALCFFTAYAWTQESGSAFGPAVAETSALLDDQIKIFPNPATDYIVLSNDEGVEKMIIYNVVGRPLKTFKTQKGEKYLIADLNPGNYLVQLLDSNSKIITTQRINKR